MQILLAIPKRAVAAVEFKPPNAKKQFYVEDALRQLQRRSDLSPSVQPMLVAATAAVAAFHRLMGRAPRPTAVKKLRIAMLGFGTARQKNGP